MTREDEDLEKTIKQMESKDKTRLMRIVYDSLTFALKVINDSACGNLGTQATITIEDANCIVSEMVEYIDKHFYCNHDKLNTFRNPYMDCEEIKCKE